jgi:Protein of unknown function (DUF2975)
MNIQQHVRTARIKKLSHYLYVVLTAIQILLIVILIGIAMNTVFGTSAKVNVNISLYGLNFNPADLSLLQRILIVLHMSLGSFFLLKLLHHFRELIRAFSLGDIFNKKAIAHARHALRYGLMGYGFYWLSVLAVWIYLSKTQEPIHVSINGNLMLGLIFFGVMYILLWALEIGADLNEESELTI